MALFFLARDSQSLAAPAPAAAMLVPAHVTAAPIVPPSARKAAAPALQAVVASKPAAITAKPDPALVPTQHRPHHAGGSTKARPRTVAFDPDGSIEAY